MSPDKQGGELSHCGIMIGTTSNDSLATGWCIDTLCCSFVGAIA